MRRWTRTFVCAVGAFGMLNGLPGGLVPLPVAQAKESAGSCVSFQRTEGDRGLDYGVENSCEKKLSCTLSWTLSCEDNHGKVTSTRGYSTRFSLVENGSHSVSASADQCKQGWNIDNVRWHCDPAHP